MTDPIWLWFKTEKETVDWLNMPWRKQLRYLISKYGGEVKDFTIMQSNTRDKFIQIGLWERWPDND